jgi:hypothetical protein
MIVRDDHGVPSGYGEVQFEGLFDSIKRAARAVGNAVSSVIPDKVEDIIKAGAATAAVGLTGGAALLIPGVRQPAIQGYKMGAAIGAGIVGSQALAKGVSAIGTTTTGPASGDPAAGGAAPASRSAAPIVAGAGAGFLALGPLGAVIGGVAGYALSRRA